MASDVQTPAANALARPLSGERGVVVVIVAAALGAMLVMVALVLDYSGARRDREANQLAADAMALAGAHGLGDTIRPDLACRAAIDHLSSNLSIPAAELAAFRSDCSTAFATTCEDDTPAHTLSIPVGTYDITLTHPVPDSGTTAALFGDREVGEMDGTPCQRFGVRIEQDRANLWAAGSVELDVAALGRYLPGTGNVDAALVLLSADECNVLRVTGTGSIEVKNADGGPGYVAVDSTGLASSGCEGQKVVYREAGKGQVEAAQVALWAISVGNLDKAYSSGAVETPGRVTPSEAPVGDSAVRNRYDCDPTMGCPGTGPAHITELEAAFGSGTPEGFTRWRSVAGNTCNMSGELVIPKGDWYIDCATLKAGGSITFQGGDIVSDGTIEVGNGSGNTLRINCDDGNTSDSALTGACKDAPGSSTTWFMRQGTVTASPGDLALRRTFVYMADDGAMDLTGRTKVLWTAPLQLPAGDREPFDALLLWAPELTSMKITGGPLIDLEGVIYAPKADMTMAGNVDAKAIRAQIFSRSLEMTGTADLILRPERTRMVTVGAGRTTLIR